MRKVDTLLFDLDGTLIDTNEVIIGSFRQTFNTHFPNKKVTREDILTYIGPTLHQTFGEYTHDPLLVEEMIKTYRETYVAIEEGMYKIYPYVKETMITLKEQGYNLCIVTSKFKEAAWPSFTNYGLEKVFDAFVALDDVTNPKPDKEPVLKALSYFPNYKGAIMIGDNQGDILAGKNANIYSAGVAWSIKGESYLNEVSPDFMLHDIRDIFSILNTLNKE